MGRSVPPAHPVLIPENIEKWSTDLEIPKSEVYIFHALREASVARLFEHNPWIVAYIRSAIVDYGRGIHIDMDAIQRQAEDAMQNFDPSQMNPESGENSFSIAQYLHLSMVGQMKSPHKQPVIVCQHLPNFARSTGANVQRMHHHNNSSRHFLDYR